jgi:hypothetical protein
MSVPSKLAPSKPSPSKSASSKSASSKTPYSSTPTKGIFVTKGTEGQSKVITYKKVEEVLRKKKKQNEYERVRTPKDLKKLQRRIQNRLGSLESMFGESTSAKVSKKSTYKTSKRASRG